jgi:hypothetical protein
MSTTIKRYKLGNIKEEGDSVPIPGVKILDKGKRIRMQPKNNLVVA